MFIWYSLCLMYFNICASVNVWGERECLGLSCEWEEAFSHVEAFSAHLQNGYDNFLPTKTGGVRFEFKNIFPLSTDGKTQYREYVATSTCFVAYMSIIIKW